MVAGDTKKVVVIKNISSNLIEEAILILKNEPGAQDGNRIEKTAQGRLNARNDFILKEAESIINQYIKENGLTRTHNRHGQSNRKVPYISISVNTFINILLISAIAFLIWVAVRFF